MSHELRKIRAAVDRIMEDGKRGLLVTVIATHGSTYRRAGARTVISEGTSCGAISGGCVERDLALRKFDGFEGRVITYDSSASDDIVFGLGLGCRGVIEMLVQPFDREHPPALPPIPESEPVIWTTTFEGRELLTEVIEPQRAIAVFGSGEDVQPVTTLAQNIGWRVDVFRGHQMPSSLDYDAVVVMTHNFLRDVDVLQTVLPSDIPYIGLLGPKTRGEEVLAELREISAEARARLHNPIGLDLGGDSPEDIALAIVAEIQAVLNQRRAASLREKDGPIHQQAIAFSVPSNEPRE